MTIRTESVSVEEAAIQSSWVLGSLPKTMRWLHLGKYRPQALVSFQPTEVCASVVSCLGAGRACGLRHGDQGGGPRK